MCHTYFTLPILSSSFCSSFPYSMQKSRSLAKSVTLRTVPEPIGRAPALYPKDSTRASHISGSKGSHFSGQKRSGSLSFVQVFRLVPPSPCTKMISTAGTVVGSYMTFKPRGFSCLDGHLPSVSPVSTLARGEESPDLVEPSLRRRPLTPSPTVPSSSGSSVPLGRREFWRERSELVD